MSVTGVAETMFYELRTYRIATGRLPSMIDRFACLPSIFERHGIQNLGRWRALAGPDVPAVIYLMGYRSLDDREEQWASFYTDPEWAALRLRTNDGEEMVESFELEFLRRSAAWQFPAQDGSQLGGVHELRRIVAGVGQSARVNDLLSNVYLPAIANAGGHVMLVADDITGPSLPAVSMFVAWPDIAAFQTAEARFEQSGDIGARLRSQRVDPGGTALGRSRRWLLDPLAGPLPLATLALK